MGSNRNLSPASSTLTVFSKYRTRENRPRKKSKICLNNVFKSVDEKPKLLPLKSLKVLIEEICESKENFDKKCILIEQQCETMEQYLYTYLNQKYGLKSLVLDWVTTIVNSVNVYSHEESDPDVILFGRILKEECDFDFYKFQKHTKLVIQNLLLEFLQEGMKSSTKKKIMERHAALVSGDLSCSYWRGILDRLYDKESCEFIIEQVLSEIHSSRIKFQLNDSPKEGQRSTQSISYENFVKVILKFQLDRQSMAKNQTNNLCHKEEEDLVIARDEPV